MAKSNKLINKKFIKEFTKDNIWQLSKDEVFSIYSMHGFETNGKRMNKNEMLAELEKVKVDYFQIYQKYKNSHFGLSAFELYELIKIDKKIKDKMLKDNLIQIAYKRDVKTKFKKWIEAPYFLLEDLYKIDKAKFEDWKNGIKAPTEKQLKAIEKARNTSLKNRTCKCGRVVSNKNYLFDGKCGYCIEEENIEKQRMETTKEFQEFLDNKDKYLIMDTETTGLDYDDQIVEIAICDMDGNALLNTKVFTEKPISVEASNVNGIYNEQLKGKPTISEINNNILDIIKDKIVLIYNSSFDERMLYQSGFEGKINTKCLMYLYMSYINSDRWISLQNALYYEDINILQSHGSFDDCLCCLELIKSIALN